MALLLLIPAQREEAGRQAGSEEGSRGANERVDEHLEDQWREKQEKGTKGGGKVIHLHHYCALFFRAGLDLQGFYAHLH